MRSVKCKDCKRQYHTAAREADGPECPYCDSMDLALKLIEAVKGKEEVRDQLVAALKDHITTLNENIRLKNFIISRDLFSEYGAMVSRKKGAA